MNTITRLLVVAATIGGITVTNTPSTHAASPATSVATCNRWFPIGLVREWRYEVENGLGSVIMSSRHNGLIVTAKVRDRRASARLSFGCDNGNLVFTDRVELPLAPLLVQAFTGARLRAAHSSGIFLPADPSPGSEWEYSIQLGSPRLPSVGRYEALCRAEGDDTVQLPNGNPATARRVVCKGVLTIQRPGFGIPDPDVVGITETTWYALNTGPVQYHMKAPALGVETRLQLVEIRYADFPPPPRPPRPPSPR